MKRPLGDEISLFFLGYAWIRVWVSKFELGFYPNISTWRIWMIVSRIIDDGMAVWWWYGNDSVTVTLTESDKDSDR